MTRIPLIVVLALLAAPAVAAEVGTCLTASGVRIAPWTDPTDPACGEDCGLEPDDDETLCSTVDGACRADDQRLVRPTMPAPAGPRCLEPGPECSSGDPVVGGVPAGVAALTPPLPDAPRRIQGTLPGAGPPCTEDGPLDRDTAPEPRPPTARAVTA